MISRRQFAALAGPGVLALTALGPTRAAAAAHQVRIQGFAFVPAELTVKAGDTVTFTNMDGARHTATATDGSFDTGRLRRGESADVTLSEAGDHAYFCELHPRMKGAIRVTA